MKVTFTLTIEEIDHTPPIPQTVVLGRVWVTLEGDEEGVTKVIERIRELGSLE